MTPKTGASGIFLTGDGTYERWLLGRVVVLVVLLLLLVVVVVVEVGCEKVSQVI